MPTAVPGGFVESEPTTTASFLQIGIPPGGFVIIGILLLAFIAARCEEYSARHQVV